MHVTLQLLRRRRLFNAYTNIEEIQAGEEEVVEMEDVEENDFEDENIGVKDEE